MSTIILAAGIGKRMYSKTPKLLHKILGKPIISFVIDLARNIKGDEIVVVIGKNGKEIKRAIGRGVKFAVQPVPSGSGDAARKGLVLASHTDILILNGDVPLLTKNTVLKLIDYHDKKNADMTILTCEVKNPFGYGRIVRKKKSCIAGIVEQSDATVKQQKINEINAGVYYGKKKLFSSILSVITSQNRQGEFYITDIVKEMIKRKKKVVGLKIHDEEEIMGINSKYDLSRAREIVKMQWYKQLMYSGIYIEDPSTTTIDLSVKIGNYVQIRPQTVLEGNTKIKDGMTVGPFEWIKNGKRMKFGMKFST